MKLELKNQQAVCNAITPKIQQLQAVLDARKELWDKLTPDKKEAWISNDPVLLLSNDLYTYLKDYFGELDG